MSASSQEIDASPLSCSVCGRSSIWREAFKEVSGGAAKHFCCPGCAKVAKARTDRSELVSAAIFVALAFVYLTVAKGHGPDLLVIWILLFGLAQLPLTLLHEFGHALAARILRVPVFAIVVGREPWLFDRPMFGLRFRIGGLSAIGLTYHAVCTGRHAAAKRLWIAAAGPLTNLLIAAAAFAAAAGMTGKLEHSLLRLTVFMVAIASTVQFVWNIWPHKVKVGEERAPSDGALILAVLRGGRESPQGLQGLRHYFRASFAYHDRAFETAAREAAKARARETNPEIADRVAILEAAARCELDEASRAIEILSPLCERGFADAGTRAMALDNLGWAFLMLDEPESLMRGLALIEEACDIAPWEDSYVISLACAFAATATPENGRAAEARQFLATMNLAKQKRQNAAYAALAQGLCAIAEGEVATARTHYAHARSRGATAAPLRLLERRLASG